MNDYVLFLMSIFKNMENSVLSQNLLSSRLKHIKRYMKHLTTVKPDKSHLTEKTLFQSRVDRSS